MHGIKEDSLAWQPKSGELCRATTTNGSTGTATDNSKLFKAKRFYYNFTLQNPDGFDRQAHYEVRVNGNAIVNWTGNISSNVTRSGYVDYELTGFNTLTTQASVTSNTSSGYAFCSNWEELA